MRALYSSDPRAPPRPCAPSARVAHKADRALAAVAAGMGELAGPVGHLVARRQEQQGIVADDDHHRAGLSRREIIIADEAAILGSAHAQPGRVRVMDYPPVVADRAPVVLVLATVS